MNVRSHITHLVTRALEEAQRGGHLPPAPAENPAIERPQNPEHGDYACSLPLKLARPMGMSPMSVAEKVVSLMPVDEALERAWAAPPGFINLSLSREWMARRVDHNAEIIAKGDHVLSNLLGKIMADVDLQLRPSSQKLR